MAKEKAKEIEEKEEIIEEDEYEEVSNEERIANIEKKVNWILGLCVLVTILTLLISVFVISGDGTKNYSNSSSESSEKESSDEQSNSSSYDVSSFKEIKAKDIEKESKNKTIVIYIGRSTCGYCVQYVPILKSVQEKFGYTTYYIDIAKILDYTNGGVLDEEANKTMKNMKTSSSQKDVMNDWGATPLTIVVKNNQIIDSIWGYTDEETVTKLIKDNGIAK